MKLTTEVKTHKLVFKDKEKQSINLTSYQSEKIKQQWKNNDNPIEIGEFAFSAWDIKEIIPIQQKNSSYIFVRNMPEYEISIGNKSFLFEKIHIVDNYNNILGEFFGYQNGEYFIYKDEKLTEFVCKVYYLIDLPKKLKARHA